MTDRIRMVAEFTIKPENLAAFKRLVGQLVDLVTRNEPGALSYEWFFNDDESVCTIIEVYKDVQAVNAHMANVGPTLNEIIAVAPMTFKIFGAVPDEMKPTVASMGGTVHTPFTGITREFAAA